MGSYNPSIALLVQAWNTLTLEDRVRLYLRTATPCGSNRGYASRDALAWGRACAKFGWESRNTYHLYHTPAITEDADNDITTVFYRREGTTSFAVLASREFAKRTLARMALAGMNVDDMLACLDVAFAGDKDWIGEPPAVSFET